MTSRHSVVLPAPNAPVSTTESLATTESPSTVLAGGIVGRAVVEEPRIRGKVRMPCRSMSVASMRSRSSLVAPLRDRTSARAWARAGGRSDGRRRVRIADRPGCAGLCREQFEQRPRAVSCRSRREGRCGVMDSKGAMNCRGQRSRSDAGVLGWSKAPDAFQRGRRRGGDGRERSRLKAGPNESAIQVQQAVEEFGVVGQRRRGRSHSWLSTAHLYTLWRCA